jgi:nicotinate-nucleotide pyrophosphorylase (carboxylating)
LYWSSEAPVSKEFPQIVWDDRLRQDCLAIVRLGLAEDLAGPGDVTTRALVPEDALGSAAVVARRAGVMAGSPSAELALQQVDPRLRWSHELEDGQAVHAGERIGMIGGPAGAMLTAERLVLNLLGRLCGIATLTRDYVDQVTGTKARIYDTRKTTPGWRRLEKYAVSCGGGWNHRAGLFAAVLIKDNHLAWGADVLTPAEAVRRARVFLQQHAAEGATELIVEVEVEALDQLADVLREGPDIVLLDNLTPEQLRQAVALRNRLPSSVELEASGGVNLSNVRAVAETGVERISVGALTHAAPASDFGLDAIDLESS